MTRIYPQKFAFSAFLPSGEAGLPLRSVRCRMEETNGTPLKIRFKTELERHCTLL